MSTADQRGIIGRMAVVCIHIYGEVGPSWYWGAVDEKDQWVGDIHGPYERREDAEVYAREAHPGIPLCPDSE